MKQVADLLFEARMLKDLNRSGYAFLGTGTESVAAHCFTTAFICFVMARMAPRINAERLTAMALVHDMAEARTGDFNYVQKQYAAVDESKAIAHFTRDLPFAADITSLMAEFNAGETQEARLARDADQLSFILELKKLKDTGASFPDKWLEVIVDRLKTDLGRQMADSILETRWDEWWMNGYKE
ncbi:MAG: HD domain-containing protein [Desulfotignum sp.]|nr:HD domain-containing protein [Desulfotignum sp.]MCF8113874.1 HD domain-containing protein [Desulfotignum sp.]MCF8126260.1 HD domain-containing protein [Desulfotignum sp.]